MQVPIHVYGPDTHITAIVPLALGVQDTHGLHAKEEDTSSAAPSSTSSVASAAAASFNAVGTPHTPSLAKPKGDAAAAAAALAAPDEATQIGRRSPEPTISRVTPQHDRAGHVLENVDASAPYNLFTPSTRSIVYGMQQRAVQGMLDFDWLW